MDNAEVWKNVKHLLSLIEENPGVEILPLVETEIVMDDTFSSWLAGWGSAKLDRYYQAEERIYVESEHLDELRDEMSERTCDAPDLQGISDAEYTDKIDAIVEALPWRKAIIVNIVTNYIL